MNVLLSLAVAMVAGLILTRVVKLVHLPNVTGYLVAGLLIGPCCLGAITAAELPGLELITTLALGFIAFSIGAEFRLSHIREIGLRAIVITVFQATMALVLVDATLWLLGFPLPVVLTLGAVATATAPAATIMVVRQYRAKGEVTNTLLPVVAMDDAYGLIAFSISIAIAGSVSSGAAGADLTAILLPLAEIGLSLVIGFAIGLVLALAMRFFHSRVNRLMLSVAAVLLGVGISQAFGLSDLLLCMSIGGAFVNLRRDSGETLDGVESWTQPLYLLFFVISGAQLDLAVLPTVGVLGVAYIIARSLGKYFGAYLGAVVTHAAPNIRKYLGITLLPQAGVAIGMAELAVSALPEYGAQIRAVTLCATLVYELAGPLLTKLALTKAGEIEPRAR